MNATDILEIKTFASLDTVGTENYIRYGISDPRRFLNGEARGAIPDIIDVQLELSDSTGTLLYQHDALHLKRVQHVPSQQTVWSGQFIDQKASLTWVWDFYRILSHVVLQVTKDGSSQQADNLLAVCQKLNAGAILTLAVADRIMQKHTIR